MYYKVAVKMEIIPVIDIKGGSAVSGKSGRREEYKPLKTIFCDSSNPIAIARSIPSRRLYVADLDGVMENKPDFDTLEKLSQIKKIMVDPGIRGYENLKKLSEIDADIIIGTETLEDIDVLKKAVETFRDKIIVSIDIKEGRVSSKFLPKDPIAASGVLKVHCKRFIFLNITSVGTLSGQKFDYLKGVDAKGVEVMVGGGVRGKDLGELEKLGVNAVLIGTALHKGLIEI
ncbi:MAG: HisA/HisF family protein [Candidatus Hydrothermarchaeales archaeon]